MSLHDLVDDAAAVELLHGRRQRLQIESDRLGRVVPGIPRGRVDAPAQVDPGVWAAPGSSAEIEAGTDPSPSAFGPADAVIGDGNGATPAAAGAGLAAPTLPLVVWFIRFCKSMFESRTLPASLPPDGAQRMMSSTPCRMLPNWAVEACSRLPSCWMSCVRVWRVLAISVCSASITVWAASFDGFSSSTASFAESAPCWRCDWTQRTCAR
jgi:hypothetical protein